MSDGLTEGIRVFVSMDRDMNGARGEFLRALEDTPLVLVDSFDQHITCRL